MVDIDNAAEFPSLDPTTGKLRKKHVPLPDGALTEEELDVFKNEIALIDGVFWAGDSYPPAQWIANVRAIGKTPLWLKQVRKGDSIKNPRLDSSYNLIFDLDTFDPLTGDQVAATVNLGSVRGPAGRSAYDQSVAEGFIGTFQEWIASFHGRDGSNVLPIDQMNAEAIEDRTSPHSKALYAAIYGGTKTLVATYKNHPNISDNGLFETSTGIQEVVDSALPGTTIAFSGTYLIGKAINIPATKLLTLDLNSATFIRQGTDRIWNVINVNETPVSVSSVTQETITVDGHTATVAVLNFDGPAPSWKRTERLRLVADDVIPNAHVTNTTLLPRIGESVVVHEATGNKVYLRRLLKETYVTNVRAARVPYASVTINGGRYDVTEEVMTNKTSGQLMRLEGLMAPVIDSPVIQRWVGTGISMRGCQSYSIRNAVTEYAMNDIGESILGYALHDASGEDGVIEGGSHHGTRHAFTDGTAVISPNQANLFMYGRTYNIKLINVTSTGSTSAAFDTHGMSWGVQFINCTAYCNPENSGFALRSLYHAVIGCRVIGGRAAVSVYNQESGVWSQGQSFGSIVRDLYAEDVDRVFQIRMHESENDPRRYIRDDIPNLDADGVRAVRTNRMLYATNANIRLYNASIRSQSSAEGAIIHTENTLLLGGEIDIDTLPVTGYRDTNCRLVGATDPRAGGGSNIYLGRMRVMTSSAYREGAVSPLYASTNTKQFSIEPLEIIGARWSAANTFDFLAGNRGGRSVSWFYRDVDPTNSVAKYSSAFSVYTDAEIETTMRTVGSSRDPQLVVQLNVATGTRRIASLPPGLYNGQRLSLWLISAGGNVVITHGSAANTRLNGNVDRTLSVAGTAVHFQWALSAWREV